MRVVSISPSPIMIPGTMPAANSAPIDTFMTKPYRTMMPDGGMIGPITAAAAVTAAAKLRL
jgi:hypothetical protein